MGTYVSPDATYVSSVAYPLGEDGVGKTDYLKYTVLNAVLQNRPIAESITQGYLRGQGMSLRNAFNYARDHYADGIAQSNSHYVDQPDLAEVRAILEQKHTATINFITTVLSSASFMWWAEQYLTQTYGYDRTLGEFIKPPEGVEVKANIAYDLEDDGLIRILLMNTDGSTKVLSFRPTDLKLMNVYMHSAYQTVQSFDGGTTVSTRPATVGELDSVSISVTIIDRVAEQQETTVRSETDIVAGVATTTVVRTTRVTSRPQYFIYRIGSGGYPQLDVLEDSLALFDSPYYPSVPLRVNGVDMVAEAKQSTALYKTGKKLLNKVGLNIDKLGESVNANESVGDIDFAFVVFGVSLKTESQEGKRYLFRYFEYLRGISQAGKTNYNGWQTTYNADSLPTHLDGGGAGRRGPSGTVTPPTNAVQVNSYKNRDSNYDIRLQWQYVDTNLKSGVIFVGARPGDVDITMSAVRDTTYLFVDTVLDASKLYARKQVDENTYIELEIAGLTYENSIYNNKTVIITAYNAMTDVDESGFIIPLHQGIVRSMPLVELTDLSYQCMHMVFNCYTIVKQRWYQKTVFQIIMVVIAIVVIVASWGSATPAVAQAMSGYFVGMGIAVAVAQLLAATIYVLAMMVLMKILTKASVELFGEKWGAVIAMVVMFVAMNWSSLAQMSANIAANGVGSVITASTVMQASAFMFNAYSAYANGQMSQVQKEALGLQTEFDKQMKEIEELTKLNLDTSLDMIDIQGYTEVSYRQMFEMPDTFLTRTLLTGGDICNITAGMIDNFADVGLQLPTTG